MTAKKQYKLFKRENLNKKRRNKRNMRKLTMITIMIPHLIVKSVGVNIAYMVNANTKTKLYEILPKVIIAATITKFAFC